MLISKEQNNAAIKKDRLFWLDSDNPPDIKVESVGDGVRTKPVAGGKTVEFRKPCVAVESHKVLLFTDVDIVNAQKAGAVGSARVRLVLVRGIDTLTFKALIKANRVMRGIRRIIVRHNVP